MKTRKIDKILISVIVILLLYLAGTVYADLTGTEGLAIDLSSAGAGTDFTIAFDPTELLGSRTFGDGSTDTIVWTWNRATGTDPTITFGNGALSTNSSVTATGSFIIGAADMSEADLEKLDGITNGTAAANKALVLGGSKEISTITTAGITNIELGHASDTTLTRTSAGDVDIEGNIVYRAGGTDVPVADGGTGQSNLTNLITLTTHTTGNYSTGNAEGGDALVSIKVEISDNESTAENNPIVFVAGAAQSGGDLALETDGTAYYTPSSGTITTTQFVGGGAGVTSVDAITGDSATAFFDAGEIEHERGGLQADISAFTGLIAVTGADTTAEIDSKSELEGQIADVGDFAEADGDIFTNVHDFGGATSLEIPNAESADGTLSALGQIHIRGDEDRVSYHMGAGGEVAGEVTVSVLPMLTTSVDPGGWYDSDAEIFLFPVLAKKFPNGIIIDYWECSCNVDPDVEINADLRYADAWIGLANAADIDEIDTTNGTSSEDTDGNINGGSAIVAGKVIYIGFDADPEGTCTQMKFTMLFHAEED